MKLPIRMLRNLVATSLSDEAIGELLTMAGFELEDLTQHDGMSVLDIKVMSNRGDGLSALGIAREVLAKDAGASPTETYAKLQRLRSTPQPNDDQLEIAIESDACAAYAGYIVRGVENMSSPAWLIDVVTAAGMRSISLLVDLANYVMLEVGQPLHVFDVKKLAAPKITAREARAGETITTLDGAERALSKGMLLICDDRGPVAIAGVMGGELTEATSTSSDVLLESAHFDAASVRRTRKLLNLSTEASYRFERNVDPGGVVAAAERFCQLLIQECPSARVESRKMSVRRRFAPISVSVRTARAERLLGMEIDQSSMQGYLEGLGFGVESQSGSLSCTVPSWRFDVTREEDLVEEIGRVHGYDKIPATLPSGATTPGGVSRIAELKDRVRAAMLRCGLSQIMAHTLRDKGPLDFKSDLRVTVRTPHSPETAFLRDSLLPGLADVARRNEGRDLHLFEIGNVFVAGEVQIDESPEVAWLSTGRLHPPHWRDDASARADFFSAKGIVLEIAETLGIEVQVVLPKGPDRRLHPTRQAGVTVDQGRLWAGTFGQLHPDVAEQLNLPPETFLGELDLFVLATEQAGDPQLREFSRNPAVRRDMAVVVSKDVPYAEIEQAIAQGCGSLLERQWLFDVYEGKGIEPGMHSLAVALQLRAHGRNLTDEEANRVRDHAAAALESLGARLR